MISTEEMNLFGVRDLEAVYEYEALDAKLASIDVVAQKQILRVFEVRQKAEHLYEIVVLPMSKIDTRGCRR